MKNIETGLAGFFLGYKGLPKAGLPAEGREVEIDSRGKKRS